jgi:hypothetical protein
MQCDLSRAFALPLETERCVTQGHFIDAYTVMAFR